jgi:hypothetical protein
MKKYLTFLFIIFAAGCFSPPSDPEYDNPFDEKGANYIAPAVVSLSVQDGAVVDTRDLTVTWTGSEVVKGYEIQLDNGPATKTADLSEAVSDLDEGSHTFSIKPYTDYKNGEKKTVTFTVDAIKGPGIVLSPRKITSDSTITLTLENIQNFMGGHIEIICTNNCVDFGGFGLSDIAKNTYKIISYTDSDSVTKLVLDIGSLKENGVTGSVVLGTFKVTGKSSGEITIDSGNTFFRDLENKDILLNGMDFVRVER